MNQIITTENYIDDVRAFLPKLIEASELVVPLFHAFEMEQTWPSFGEIVEGMDDLYRALQSIQQEISDVEEYSSLHLFLNGALEQFGAKFQMLNQNVDDENYIGAADSLQFELIPLFKLLKSGLGESGSVRERRFADNMAFLKRAYPDIFSQLQFAAANATAYQIEYNRYGVVNLTIERDSGERKRLLGLNHMKQITDWAKGLASTASEHQAIILYGFGLGDYAMALTEACPKHQLYIYEPEPQILLAALQIVNMEQLLSRAKVAFFGLASSKEQRREQFIKAAIFEQKPLCIAAAPAYASSFASEVTDFRHEAEMAFYNYVNHVRIYQRLGLSWVKNGLFNMPAVLQSPPLSRLKTALNGKTVIVVGGGPSLEQDIVQLKKLKAHAFVIAAGSAVQTLLYHEIIPHLIVSIDGAVANAQAFQHLNLSNIPMLFSPTVHFEVIEPLQREQLVHFFVGSDWVSRYFLELGDQDPVFRSNHTVTGTAVQAAIYMGCQEIIFAGQDFSYPNNQMYAVGAKHVSETIMAKSVESADITVQNVHGSVNRTTYALALALADIEELLAEHADIRFINTSQTGAKIKHTLWEPMESVYKRLKNQQVLELELDNQLKAAAPYNESRKNHILSKLASLPKNMEECSEKLTSIVSQIGKLEQQSRININKCNRMMEKIDSDWEFVVKSDVFNGLYLQSSRVAIENFEHHLHLLTEARSLQEQIAFYREHMQPLIKVLLDQAKPLMEIIEALQQRLSSLSS
ncbi:6-hydroxymethylpterin diphosphokinase MptE-like protein [Paenibacillus sp. KS-LC4]|uniref:motility associated factor glycosyltransferase family protein n=1 Tax=Paenibacillus sp. KS-LC4 TaxID=2979727 RepID=UPI0030D01E26